MLEYIQLLLVTLVLGGMVAFQVLFAPLIFIKLPSDVARPFIRKFFPFYYLYFGILSFGLMGISYLLIEQTLGVWLMVIYTAVAVGFIVSRQILMPLANRATDDGRQADFDRYHKATVAINTAQLLAMMLVLWLII